MPGQLSTTGANIGLDAATGRATQTARTVYLALLTAAPSDSTTVVTMSEVSNSTGYARQAVAFSAPTGDPSSTSNTATLTFGPFVTDPPNVTHAALVSASSGTSGDLLAYWTADIARDAANGESLQVPAGSLILTLD